MARIPAQQLRYLRNEIPLAHVIQNILDIHAKYSEGFLRFLCPQCGECNTAVNPQTNLGRCFRCEQNYNPIELVMAVRRCSFLSAVKILQGQ